MNSRTAKYLLNSCTYTTHGVDGNGDEVQSITPLGAAMWGAGVEDFYSPQGRSQAAEFLRNWASLLDAKLEEGR